MKSIINGKRYETKTATEIAAWHNGCSVSDFARCEETLYRTKSGAWFLHGEGGALTGYARSLEGGRARCGGSAIRPMTPDEALAWLEEHDEAAAIEQHFGDRVTDA